MLHKDPFTQFNIPELQRQIRVQEWKMNLLKKVKDVVNSNLKQTQIWEI